MEEQNKKPVGRPSGKKRDIPTKQLGNRIDASLNDRLKGKFPNSERRTAFIEEALKLLLDIYEGKRKLPELTEPDT